MQLHVVVPLSIETASNGILELMPVVMKGGLPSKKPANWQKFLKTEGKRIPISPITTSKCQRYMQQHNTEALSEDGMVAYTIAGNALVECLPEDCDIDEEAVA